MEIPKCVTLVITNWTSDIIIADYVTLFNFRHAYVYFYSNLNKKAC